MRVIDYSFTPIVARSCDEHPSGALRAARDTRHRYIVGTQIYGRRGGAISVEFERVRPDIVAGQVDVLIGPLIAGASQSPFYDANAGVMVLSEIDAS